MTLLLILLCILLLSPVPHQVGWIASEINVEGLCLGLLSSSGGWSGLDINVNYELKGALLPSDLLEERMQIFSFLPCT